MQERRAEIFSLLYHDEQKLLQPFYSNIFPGSKKKKEKISPKRDIFPLDR